MYRIHCLNSVVVFQPCELFFEYFKNFILVMPFKNDRSYMNCVCGQVNLLLVYFIILVDIVFFGESLPERFFKCVSAVISQNIFSILADFGVFVITAF